VDQEPEFFLDAHSLGKLLPAIRALEAPSSVVPTLLKHCSEPMAKLSKLGWTAKIALREGVEKTYASFLAEKAAGTLRS
jgi:hypothetical protein